MSAFRASATLVVALLTALPPAAAAAQVQLQLSCSGTVLDARGSATLKRAISSLRVNLSVQAEAPSSKAALTLVQQRLDAVRRALQALKVNELRVSSPTVWNRYVPAGQPAVFEASSQVSGQLAPEQLQGLIAQVGSLSGVRLSPVDAEADQSTTAAAMRQLLQAAYSDALQRGKDLAAAMAPARSAPAPFDPRELPEPSDRLSLEVTFCALP